MTKYIEWITYKEFVDALVHKVQKNFKDPIKYPFPMVSFAMWSPQEKDAEGKTMQEIDDESECWLGIRRMDSLFNSDDLLLQIDRYGGGCCEVADFIDSYDTDSIRCEMRDKIDRACAATGYGELKNSERVTVEWEDDCHE